MTQELKRKLSAILSADVKGYSRLMGEDEEWTVRTLDTFKGVMKTLIPQHRGRVVDSPGDNLLAEFASVVDAVQAAVEIQQVLRAKNALLPAIRRMEFRIGINLGDVIEEGDRIFGDGVNIAARMEGLADPGGICISGSAFEQIENKLPLHYDYLGEHEVKNITRPVRVYRALMEDGPSRPQRGKPILKIAVFGLLGALLVTSGAALWQYATRAPSTGSQIAGKEGSGKPALPVPDKPSIVVLPFENMSADPEQAYFADGITEDLITDLSKIAGLFVIARNSAFAYKGKTENRYDVAKALGVRYVLEGSVRRSGAEIRVNAQLIDSVTGGHIWADRYDGDLKQIFSLQDTVTRNVVNALAVTLTKDDRARVAQSRTGNVQAYDLFLRGWQHYLRQTPEGFRSAVEAFNKAVELDPTYGRAYAALAATYWEAYRRYWGKLIGLKGIHLARAQAEQFLESAMKDPTPLAHQVASAMLLHQREYEDALAEANLAISGDPNDADGYVSLANVFNFTGKAEGALELLEHAMRLNPHYPPSYLYQMGLAQFGVERFQDAAGSLQRALTLNQDDYWSQRLLLSVYGLTGKSAEASQLLETLKEQDRRGTHANQDPLTIRAVTFWYPFSRQTDLQRFSDGLRIAGVPE